MIKSALTYQKKPQLTKLKGSVSGKFNNKKNYF